MLDPGMEIFYLTDHCDNRCLFCICKKRIRENEGDSPDVIEEKLRGLRENGTIDLYGGEPTLSGHFMEIVRRAKRKRCFINIASNARSFSRAEFFAAFLKETEDYRDRILVRSSLHGHTAAIHDLLTCRQGSFDEAVGGIRNLKQAGYRVAVNTVVTGQNYRNLGELHSLVCTLGVDIYKLSFMRHTLQNARLAVTLEDLKAELPVVLEQVARSRTVLQLDSVPYCVAPEHLALFAKAEDEIVEDDKRLAKAEKCETCAMDRMCPGVDREYFELFGDGELEPIRRRLDTSLVTRNIDIDSATS